jgi:hypothetical protein
MNIDMYFFLQGESGIVLNTLFYWYLGEQGKQRLLVCLPQLPCQVEVEAHATIIMHYIAGGMFICHRLLAHS